MPSQRLKASCGHRLSEESFLERHWLRPRPREVARAVREIESAYWALAGIFAGQFRDGDCGAVV